MKRLIPFFFSLTIAALAADAPKPADPAKPSAPAAPGEPAQPASAEVKVHAPTDLATLKELKGQKVVVQGIVANAGANKTETIRYLNFTANFRESVSLVFFANAGGGTFTKAKLAEYVGKTVRVTGVLSEYNGALQIRMESLEQIQVIEVPPATPPPAPAK